LSLLTSCNELFFLVRPTKFMICVIARPRKRQSFRLRTDFSGDRRLLRGVAPTTLCLLCPVCRIGLGCYGTGCIDHGKCSAWDHLCRPLTPLTLPNTPGPCSLCRPLSARRFLRLFFTDFSARSHSQAPSLHVLPQYLLPRAVWFFVLVIRSMRVLGH